MHDTPLELGARLLQEFDHLRELPPLGTLLYMLVMLALGWGLARSGPALVHLVWRVRLDPLRRLGLLGSATRVAGLLLSVLGLVQPLLEPAPTLVALSMLLLLGLAGVIAPAQLHNLASGLTLATRTRLREGDLIRIGKLEGTVRDIGLLYVDLRTLDGGVTHVPAADFAREAVTVGSRHATVPIVGKLALRSELEQADLDRLRRALWMSPYRRANTQVRIDYDPQRAQLEVRIDTWAGNAAIEVERHVQQLLVELSAGEPLTTEPEQPAEGM